MHWVTWSRSILFLPLSPSILFLPLSHLLAALQEHWLSCCFLNPSGMFSPQGFYICCLLFMERSFTRWLNGWLPYCMWASLNVISVGRPFLITLSEKVLTKTLHPLLLSLTALLIPASHCISSCLCPPLESPIYEGNYVYCVHYCISNR